MFLQLQVWAFMLLQEGGADRVAIRARCGSRWAGSAKLVVILLFFMSAWSIGVMIDRADRLQRRPQTVAAVRPGSGRRAARRQAG